MMKKIFYSSLLLFLCLNLSAQIIPDANRVDWTAAGYPGDFPEPATVISVMDFGAVGDGVADDRPAILSAITSLNNQAGVIFFPGGTYKITST